MQLYFRGFHVYLKKIASKFLSLYIKIKHLLVKTAQAVYRRNTFCTCNNKTLLLELQVCLEKGYFSSALFQWALVATGLETFHVFKTCIILLKEIILSINKASKCLKYLFTFNYVKCFSLQQNLKDALENLIFVLCYFPFMYSQVYFIYLVTGARPETDVTVSFFTFTHPIVKLLLMP